MSGYPLNVLVSGAFSASGSSPTLTPQANAPFYVHVLFSNIAPASTFKPCDTSFQLKRSVDNGANWSTVNQYSFATTSSGSFAYWAKPGETYRLDATVPNGSACYLVTDGCFPLITPMLTLADLSASQVIFPVEPGISCTDARLPWVANTTKPKSTVMTVAQFLAMTLAKCTAIADADLSGDFTMYKLCTGNTFAKMTVPAAAQRCKEVGFQYGNARTIRAEYADVVSIVDGSGNALSSATSFLDAPTVYTVGSRTIARDFYGTSTGAFTSSTNAIGIRGFPTLIEATQLNPRGPTINLTALGL